MRRIRLGAFLAMLLVIPAALVPPKAAAHAGLIRSDPVAGATLGAAPATVKLFFSERPEPSLSEVHVTGPGGRTVSGGRLQLGEDQSLVAPLGKLRRGVYTVNWRSVSAVDGHASAGAFAFGVGVSPRGAPLAVPQVESSSSALEVLARWLLLIGLVLLLGACVAGVAGFGGTGGSDLRLAAAGWAVAVAGLVLLAIAQLDTAGSSFSELLETPVGEALIWRAVALAAAGMLLLVAWGRAGRARALALAACATATVGCIVAHVAAGHAAAGSWPEAISVVTQVAHFAAAGVWFGGLAALLLGVRGAPSEANATAVRRFSSVALGAVVLVAVTGTVRSIDELTAWDDLIDSGYGRAVVAKIVLLGLIVALATRHRRRSVPAAATDLRPLRSTSRFELGLATAAVFTAALLGTLAPAVARPPSVTQGLSAAGADFATTTRVELKTVSSEPGPNRFDARVEDYDSRDPVEAPTVRLRFVALDDSGVAPTSLTLRRRPDGTYSGSGPNLTFDGRWGVTALVDRSGEQVEVPLTLDVRGPVHDVSVLRPPGKAPQYEMQIENLGYVVIKPDPERAGPSLLSVFVLNFIEARVPARQIVVTTQAGDGAVRQQSLRRRGAGWYEANVVLTEGLYKVTVVARTPDGARLRAPFELDVPAR